MCSPVHLERMDQHSDMNSANFYLSLSRWLLMAGVKLRKFSMLHLMKNRSAAKLHLCRTFMRSLRMVSKTIAMMNYKNREISKKLRGKMKMATKIIRRNRTFKLKTIIKTLITLSSKNQTKDRTITIIILIKTIPTIIITTIITNMFQCRSRTSI